jgi:long-chain fatty acid transport protein
LLFPLYLFADESHYQNIIIGERAFGLGGAFTSLATDGSAVFYNPAGLAFQAGSSISLSANFYRFLSETVENGSRIGSLVSDQKFSDFDAFPTGTTSVWELKKGDENGIMRQKLAFSVFIIDNTSISHRQNLDNISYTDKNEKYLLKNFTKFDRVDDVVYHGALAYSIRPFKNISFGVSGILLGRILSQTSENDAVNSKNNGAKEWNIHLLDRVQMWHVSLMASASVLCRFDSGFRIGLNIMSPNLKVYGRADFIKESDKWGKGYEPEFISGSSNKQNANFKMPLKIAIGASYEKERKFAFSGDISIYDGLDEYLSFDDPDYSSIIKKNSIYNFNLGAEYYILPILPVRAGFYTNYSSSPHNPDKAEILTDFDLYGITSSLSLEEENISMTMGFGLSFGQGMTETYTEEGRTETQLSRRIYHFLIGTSYHY